MLRKLSQSHEQPSDLDQGQNHGVGGAVSSEHLHGRLCVLAEGLFVGKLMLVVHIPGCLF